MDNLTWAYVIVAAGLLLMVLEVSVPAHGVLFILGLLAEMFGVALVFYHGDRYLGFATLAGVCVLVPLATWGLMHLWPKTPMGKRLAIPAADEAATVAYMPVVQELEVLRGRIGQAVSMLRPAGVVEFDGRRIDVLTEGPMVEVGTWVKCIDVKAGKVIVRPLDQPPALEQLDTADWK